MNGVKLARKKIDGLEGHMPAVDAAHLTLSQRFVAIEALLPMAALRADEDEEYIHQLRVASRRADAALRVFEPFVKGKAYRKARKGLKKIRQAAGEARRCDVQIGMLRELSHGIGSEHRTSAAQRLVALIQDDRRKAQGAVKSAAEKYHGKKLSKLRSAVLKSLGPIVLDRNGESEQAMTFAALAHARLSRLARHVHELMNNISASDVAIIALHALRIRAKRLRYAMEVFAPCYRDGLKPIYKRIESMQDALGAINDLDDLAARLAKELRPAAAKHGNNGNVAFSLEEHAALDALRQELLNERDARAGRFVEQLRQGEWHDVVDFDAEMIS